MKKHSQRPNATLPPVPVNERLNQETGKVLFPAKLKRAQEALARVGLPAGWGEKPASDAKATGGKVTQPIPVRTQPKKAA